MAQIRHRFILFFIAAFFIGGVLFADETNPPSLWFPVGEELVYTVHWGFLDVGESHVTTEWVKRGGRQLLSVRIKTKTNGIVDKIYPVDDLIESIIDPVSFLPVRFSKRLSEGRYRTDETTVFDHKNKVAHWSNRKDRKNKDFPIETNTRDLVSFMYHMRSEKMEPDTQSRYRVMADDKIYDLLLHNGEVEDVSLEDYGDVPSLKIEPEASFGGIFVRKGKIWVWVSNDSRRIITKIVGKVPVASIALYLAEVRGPGNDRWVSKTEDGKKTDPEKKP